LVSLLQNLIQIRFDQVHGGSLIGINNNIITPEDLGRLVATNAHRNRFTNPFETQISSRGSPGIVNLQTLIGSISAIC
jgi:hypothetical protein